MSELRKQLQIARDEYQSVKYPGNLVADLQRRRGFNPMRLAPYALVAAAAVVALVIWLQPATPVENPGKTLPIATNTESSFTPTYMAMPSDVVPSIPTATMSMPTLSVPSVPSIPTWSVSTDVSLEESSSTQG